ncbi:DUF309 domain-containing protein [Priestia flexa]|uniref:DUF309 domain-containing protein n=2 Tax=Priestia TaxID=2800373 RepID=A0A0V8JRR3_9BACI|nr:MULTISPECIES: DUF309 domain-containing protein [Bacillaceae]AQX53868.1 hypothetical protein BC359_05850 [Priestia flexa]KSU89549.1 hypothetical protein AS180_01705 [Priestia veravalensis]KZB92604.1 hypothetical protein A2U94_05170 [Bacillus sp. VT 712]MBY6084988.1 DUF309 domain-containing protein [Priestia flexa]MCA1200514.1 DUF309 domain-containing protein [Priestia flexa]
MYPKPYIDYLVYFHTNRDYFECHEVLEEHWKVADPRHRNVLWVGLIQVAVSLYHHRRSNYVGAERTMKKAISILDAHHQELFQIGLQPIDLISILNKHLRLIQASKPYQSLNMPIVDEHLVQQCHAHPLAQTFGWLTPSNLQDEHLIHRHKLRDRTAIIAERAKKLRKSRASRS